MPKQLHRALALVVCCAAVLVAPAAATAADPSADSGKLLSLTAENVNKVSDAFMKLLSDPYDLSDKVLPNDYSINRVGLTPQALKAAEDMRAKLRQSLNEVVDIAVNRTCDFVRSAEAQLAKTGGQRSELLQRLSSIPVSFDANGNTLVSNPLTAIATFLANTVQQQLKAVRQQGGEVLSQQLEQSMAGRKLLQEMDAFEAAVEEEADIIDLSQPAPRQGPVAVARQMERMMGFLTSLTEAADELVATYDSAKADGEAADVDAEADPEGAALRQLQQLPDPSAGYAKAVTLIFTNIFDFFRANGLYGLSSLLADLRGILTRFNPITDLLSLLDAPLENIINANPLPLPQSNEELVTIVRNFAKNYCKFEEAKNSETVLGEFEGPSVTYTVKPVSCPIYTDEDTGRNFVSFEDCRPATLTIKVTPLEISEAYFTAAKYTGTECKYSEPYGTDFSLAIGGGEQKFSFVRSAKGIDIVPSVIALPNRININAFETPDAEADSDLPGTNGAFGNGFFANNWGWSFNGVNPPPPQPAGK